jgi:hypothetical protein
MPNPWWRFSALSSLHSWGSHICMRKVSGRFPAFDWRSPRSLGRCPTLTTSSTSSAMASMNAHTFVVCLRVHSAAGCPDRNVDFPLYQDLLLFITNEPISTLHSQIIETKNRDSTPTADRLSKSTMLQSKCTSKRTWQEKEMLILIIFLLV